MGNDLNAILITGPTAGGKSALALEWAKRVDGAVINADSMQVYDTLRVLTARPSPDEMEGISHRLYGHVSALETYSTGAWLRAADAEVKACRKAGKIPIFVGGTGLYFRALAGGLSEMPEVPQEIRDRLRQRLEGEGAEALHLELGACDASGAARIKSNDGQRIVRALEIFQASGKPISYFQGQAGDMVVDPLRARKFVVLPERSVLHARIDGRFEQMMDGGAVEEVQALLALDPPGDVPAMKAIGVSQISAMLKGQMSRQEVIEKASAATRQYAKRQMTWFRNQMDESWERIDPLDQSRS